MRFLLFALVLAATFPSRAMNSWGTDMSDLWWNPDESGWGINISHQGDTIFATLFVYGADNRARWYVAPAMIAPGTNVTYAFSGKLYETQGPFLGGGFDPSRVTNREVGTASLNFYEVGKGTLTYGVDNALVTKEIRRQTFKRAEIVGTYVGGTVTTAFSLPFVTPCAFSQPALSGVGDTVVTLDPATSIAIVEIPSRLAGMRCRISGPYLQEGRMGSIDGTFACTGGGPSGRILAFEMEAGYNALSMRYTAEYANCVEQGRLAGVRR
jgi:hypothetical protein